MKDKGDDKVEALQPPEQNESIVSTAPVPKAKRPEITDILAPLKSIGIEDVADKRVVPFLVQALLEKVDRVRILDSENVRLQSENKELAISSARQDEQIRHARKTRLLSAGMGVLGGLLTAFAFKAYDNQAIFVVLLITGIALSLFAGVMAKL
ncbi:MAG: hypothetical protein ACLQVL_00245 [Terriglobia bacterium]